jgi:periplasmic copper chaperone A
MRSQIAAAALLASLMVVAPASAAGLRIEGAWARETPPAAKTGALYFTVVNDGAAADRLVSASTPAAGRAELHQMSMTANMMTMRAMKDGAPVPAKGRLSLAPGGSHVMLTGLKQPLKAGASLALVLKFERAGEIKLTVPVRSQAEAAAVPAAAAHHH